MINHTIPSLPIQIQSNLINLAGTYGNAQTVILPSQSVTPASSVENKPDYNRKNSLPMTYIESIQDLPSMVINAGLFKYVAQLYKKTQSL